MECRRRRQPWPYVAFGVGTALSGALAIANVNDAYPDNVTHTTVLLMAAIFCASLVHCELRESYRALLVWFAVVVSALSAYLFEAIAVVAGECVQESCPSVVTDHSGRSAAGFAIATGLVMASYLIAIHSVRGGVVTV